MMGVGRSEKFAGRVLWSNPFLTVDTLDGWPIASYVAKGGDSFLGPAQALSIPELGHSGTIGWLLNLLRKGRPEAFSIFEPESQTWAVFEGPVGMLTLLSRESTEGEALAAALLSIWGDA